MPTTEELLRLHEDLERAVRDMRRRSPEVKRAIDALDAARRFRVDPTTVVSDGVTHGVGFTIRDLYAFLAVHPPDPDEGVIGWQGMPLVAADPIRVNQLKSVAQMAANISGQQVRLVRFTTREDLETIEPAPREGT